MIEQILNLTWVAVAIVSFAMVLPRRRDVRALAALAFALALLFPIISATDDLLSNSQALEETVAVLAAIVVAFMLVMLARLELQSRPVPAVILTPDAGTRAPPLV